MTFLAKPDALLLVLSLAPSLAAGYLLGWRRAGARVRELQLLVHRKQEVIDALRWESAQVSPAR